jgi:hypothetical protein
MIFLQLSLFVALCLGESIITNKCTISQCMSGWVTFDNGYRRFAHTALANFMKKYSIDDCFVSEALTVNGKNYGTRYLNFKPLIDGEYQVIPVLDFGNLDEFQTVFPGADENAIASMKERLITFEVFESEYKIWIKNVIINGRNFGEHKINETLYFK